MSRLGRTGFAVALGTLAMTASLVGGGSADRASAVTAKPPQPEQPNIVLIESDDQTQDSMRYMSRVQSLIGEQGATFPTNVVNWPLCCPSRATLQTGQYAHNHNVLGNNPPIGGFDRLDTTRTLPVWLQRAGYHTTHIGKFLNGYEQSPVGVPPGWSEWHGSKTTYTFYGYQLFENGVLNTYGNPTENPDAPADPASYSTDVYTDKAVDLINRRAPSNQPFFLSVAYLAPHSGAPNGPDGLESRCRGSAKPALRHIGAFANERLPAPPSFNEPDATDKPASIANREYLTVADTNRARRLYRCRAESLLAIDESVGRVVDALRASGELNDTLIIYTSDNGFFHGEHRILTGKNRVYEEAVRVPLVMRGPGIPKGVTVDDISTNADLAATVADAANAETDFALDGVSLLPYAEEPDRAHGRELLIEQFSPDGEDGEPVGIEYSAIRTSKYKYVSNSTGEIELYDLEADPFELTNLHLNPAFAEAEGALAARLAVLRTCAGKTCHLRPAMKQKLPRQIRKNGRRCTPAAGFVSRVFNKAQSRLVRVEFSVDGKDAGSDMTAPFKRKLPVKLLRRSAKPEIEATAELIDGRRLTLHDKVRICR